MPQNLQGKAASKKKNQAKAAAGMVLAIITNYINAAGMFSKVAPQVATPAHDECSIYQLVVDTRQPTY